MSNIRIIPSRQQKNVKKRTAAYCRVSSSSVEQLHSYAAQVKFYTEMLSADKSCAFVGVYADEGISGTSAKKRPQFMAMIEDCRAGKIDAIITKSVSRFGRNTVDTLVFTRELKLLGIDVYFEKENLHSISPDGELLLTLMAAFAESESESMSENIAWGFRKRYAEGNTDSLPMHNVYGLDRDTATGEIFIREDEAPIVRRIYDEFMMGVNTQQISNRLNEDGVSTHRKGARWHNKTVINILRNEKYSGDVLFQKTFSPGALCHSKQNRGELPQYLLRDAIPAIIDKKQCLDAITNDSGYKARLAEVEELCAGLASRMHDNLTRESRMMDDCGEGSPLKKERDEITLEYETLQKELQELNSKIALCAAKKVQVRGFLQLLKKQKKALVEFAPLVWQAAVHYMVINEDCTVKFVFRDGTELPWVIDPGVKSYKKKKTVESCPQE